MSAGGWRFSLARLLAAIVVVAVGLAMLVDATPLWADVCSALFVFVMLVAVVAVPYRRGAARAFWLGFAILGWGYLLYGRFVVSPAPATNALNRLHRRVRRFEPPDLPSTTPVQITARGTLRVNGQEVSPDEVVDTLSAHLRQSGNEYLKIYEERDVDYELASSLYSSIQSALAANPNVALSRGGSSRADVPAHQDFLHVGHQLCNLLFALLGGLAGRLLYATRDKTDAAAP